MKAAGRWIEPVVASDFLAGEDVGCARRGIEHCATPFEFFSDVCEICIDVHHNI
jgi:hypothetical protein